MDCFFRRLPCIEIGYCGQVLDFLHIKKGICHRDISSSNVLLGTHDDDNPKIYILDFANACDSCMAIPQLTVVM